MNDMVMVPSDLREQLMNLQSVLPHVIAAMDCKAAPEGRRAEEVYRARRSRDALFGKASRLFNDPAWDMLLDLYAAQRTGRKVSVSSACYASATPQTTGWRYVSAMEDEGLIVRRGDPGDKRRVYLELSEFARERMDQWLAALG